MVEEDLWRKKEDLFLFDDTTGDTPGSVRVQWRCKKKGTRALNSQNLPHTLTDSLTLLTHMNATPGGVRVQWRWCSVEERTGCRRQTFSEKKKEK